MKKRGVFSKLNNWIIYILLTAAVAAVVVASVILIDYLRKEEIKRIELFATAMKYLQEEGAQDPMILDLILQINESNSTIPIIITDKYKKPLGVDFQRNIPEKILNNPKKMQALVNKMANSYKPIELQMPDENNQYVYYTNSDLLNNLRYSPYILGSLILAYIFFSFWFLRTIKKTDEGYVWAGLAKETAHQIGTPLSSMIGWIEILRMENENSVGVKEIENDINRLKTISERFSKIGSVPELNDLNINETVKQNYDYLKSRISKKVIFMLILPKEQVLIPHNRILLSWVIENIVKNAVDAMKGEGRLEIELYEKNKNTVIDIKDSGSGMTRTQARNAFKAGYSTKKRGWGLGLSLAKRVVKEYHRGDIKIAVTEIGVGTTFRITMRNS
ncbi:MULTISPECIES: HAMP domain-containing sensor histidine kinase [unclassified Kaistella]|uniref:sensor histidine kinase n=1 Tax=unclassified Kaistella TaxID=2762626 RepID=UPI0027358146|nr:MULTISPECIES: HAMP domain-containing sensor histidine kinase [unclassified Kaistella]MCZ2083080.1 HAMP domain-containing histidine kinase [Flavobacteriales bacterium]MDP2453102.1 HAMP domain-containing sensor histidine kinase [Kaistella sp. SH11-4b]MDP2456159.1 HAMP domain-containing sensor histidine kinase [Kaistella sp. SH40-3]MDP2458915.1 HAMP domain-containing sensor histidine kinase [Kaistella sp. SH19-2b]